MLPIVTGDGSTDEAVESTPALADVAIISFVFSSNFSPPPFTAEEVKVEVAGALLGRRSILVSTELSSKLFSKNDVDVTVELFFSSVAAVAGMGAVTVDTGARGGMSVTVSFFNESSERRGTGTPCFVFALLLPSPPPPTTLSEDTLDDDVTAGIVLLSIELSIDDDATDSSLP